MSSARIECGFCFTVPVTGFCEKCHYRLCETCSKNHPRVEMFKNHKVVRTEGSNNPTEELDIDIHERKCKIHTDEKTALFCERHDVSLCLCCLLIEHKGCIGSMIYLGNVVCDTEVLNEYISKLNELGDQAESIASEIEENIKLSAELRSKCEKDIDTFYDELIVKLLKLKKNAETEIAHKYRQNAEHLEKVLVSCNGNRQRISQQIKHIGDLVQKKHDRNLYVTLKRKGKTTNEFLCSNQQSRISNNVTKLTFARNSELEKVLKNDTLTFGITIDVCDGSEEVHEQNTEILIKTDTWDMWDKTDTKGDNQNMFVDMWETTDTKGDNQTIFPDRIFADMLDRTDTKGDYQTNVADMWEAVPFSGVSTEKGLFLP
ncbi:hypothetical protein DPMN_180972 [Dreissena polymorpha]|uniref:B box-type domain-containing protein n=1 Tax=Dreissena polymorpha TaxID=45954 RepID=A0A9D4DDB8_DREPO|nr:hypothetical protein DPMN_180972 [Dreissena polymorpha]